jgi:hypothetical protein
VRYSLTGSGFTELDATIYYEPHLAQKVPALGEHLAKLGVAINKIIQENGRGIGVGEAIVTYLDLLLGEGVPPNFNMGDVDSRLRSTAGLDGPYAYVVPETVATLLDSTWRSKQGDLPAYADLIEVLYGVQGYENASSEAEIETVTSQYDVSALEVEAGQLFNPDNTRVSGNRRYTRTPMLGTFMPSTPQFLGNRTVWSILQQYLNPSVNEMFATLRVNAHGLVQPTLVIRQLPFNTDVCDPGVPVTKYSSLPRWKIHPIMVRSCDIGRSDSTRVNFVHVYGEPGSVRGPGLDLTSQLIRNIPIRDDIDIARSGLRPYMTTVNCHPVDIREGGPQKWMDILSDFLIGQHLTVAGSLSVVGISAPICPGDNLEWEGGLYHIESVSHNCQIGMDGRKTFSTTLQLTHGIALEPTNSDLGLYLGIGPDDQRHLEPGLSIEASTDIDQSLAPSEPNEQAQSMPTFDVNAEYERTQ